MRILSIDGGGIRGIIPAFVLVTLEALTRRRISELFDLIVGTSTGGILALGCVAPGSGGRPAYTARDLLDVYLKHGGDIFGTKVNLGLGVFEEKYSNAGLSRVLHSYFGAARMNQALVDVAVTAYDLRYREPVVLSNRNGFKAAAMAHCAQATSAAPTFFEPAELWLDAERRFLIDGGVWANNPAHEALAMAEAISLDPASEHTLLSLGTGTFPEPLDPVDAASWGKAQWLRPLMEIMFDGQDDAAHHRCREAVPSYLRLQTVRPKGVQPAMDDASQSNLHALVAAGEGLVEEFGAELDTLCTALTAEGVSA